MLNTELTKVKYVKFLLLMTKKRVALNTQTRHDAQDKIFKLVGEDTILIGHQLHKDLRALGIDHRNIIDTAQVYSKQGSQGAALKDLAWDYLRKHIQSNNQKHDATEDAKTCLELIELKLKQNR